MANLLIQNFQSLGKYNQLANNRIYDACAQLSDAERKLDRKAFFGSIHNSLSHILVADRIWLGRFEGNPLTSYQLNEILFENYDDLRAARAQEDQRIQDFVDNMSEDFVAGMLTWTNSVGKSRSELHRLLVAHMFNHQTHHRGQVHNMLTQAGIKAPVLDLPWVLGD